MTWKPTYRDPFNRLTYQKNGNKRRVINDGGRVLNMSEVVYILDQEQHDADEVKEAVFELALKFCTPEELEGADVHWALSLIGANSG